MLGATVLIVLGAEWLLLAAAAPGVLGGAVFLLLGRPAPLTHPAWAALAATPLLALALATWRAGRTSPGRGRHAATGSGPAGQPHSGPRTRRRAGWLVTGTGLSSTTPRAGF